MSVKAIPEELGVLGFEPREAYIQQWCAEKVIYLYKNGDRLVVCVWLEYNHDQPGGLIRLQMQSSDCDATADVGWAEDLAILLPTIAGIVAMCEAAPRTVRR